jgi:hypothetical protein
MIIPNDGQFFNRLISHFDPLQENLHLYKVNPAYVRNQLKKEEFSRKIEIVGYRGNVPRGKIWGKIGDR